MEVHVPFSELEKMQQRLTTSRHVAYAYGQSTDVQMGRQSVKDATILAVSYDYNRIWEHGLSEGRYFSLMEARQGSPVAVLGHDVAAGLFPSGRIMGQKIRVMGRKLRVIGILEKEGQSLVGNNVDGNILVPATFLRGIMSLKDRSGAMIMAQARDEVDLRAMKDDLEGSMRSIRRLKPRSQNNFALNEISMITSNLDSLFGVIGIAGTIIGGFSVLVGGFGIANIMFVSVRERTNQIGIQKSLGAKRYFILLQFLFESIILCLIGGMLGIAIVAGLIPFIGEEWDFQITLTTYNALQGLMIAFGIGVLSGFVPALMASRLDPVEAIRRGG
mgnify:CR=1 FL=1